MSGRTTLFLTRSDAPNAPYDLWRQLELPRVAIAMWSAKMFESDFPKELHTPPGTCLKLNVEAFDWDERH